MLEEIGGAENVDSALAKAKDEAERQLTEWQLKASDQWFAPKVDKDA